MHLSGWTCIFFSEKRILTSAFLLGLTIRFHDRNLIFLKNNWTEICIVEKRKYFSQYHSIQYPPDSPAPLKYKDEG